VAVGTGSCLCQGDEARMLEGGKGLDLWLSLSKRRRMLYKDGDEQDRSVSHDEAGYYFGGRIPFQEAKVVHRPSEAPFFSVREPQPKRRKTTRTEMRFAQKLNDVEVRRNETNKPFSSTRARRRESKSQKRKPKIVDHGPRRTTPTAENS